LPWILTFERADVASRLFDPSYAPTFEVFQRHFRGWRILSTEPLEIEIFSDQIYPDAETIVAARTPSASPWHTLALGIRAESGGELAFSSNKADRMQVNWMSLVAGPSLRILDRHLQTEFVPYPEVLGKLLREGESDERFQSLRDWYRERGHFWVGDGPYYLHSVHPVERTLVLRRFKDFPDAADKWLRFTRPEIPELDLSGPMVVETGKAAEFELHITYEGAPYPEDAIETVQFLLFDGSGVLTEKQKAERVAGDLWTIRLAPEQVTALGIGANSLEVAVTSNRVALPAFASHTFATVPARVGSTP
jgi:peptide/nickel transport system substrate-binding protein